MVCTCQIICAELRTNSVFVLLKWPQTYWKLNTLILHNLYDHERKDQREKVLSWVRSTPQTAYNTENPRNKKLYKVWNLPKHNSTRVVELTFKSDQFTLPHLLANLQINILREITGCFFPVLKLCEVPKIFNTWRSRLINLIITEITVLTYPEPGNNSVNNSPVGQLRYYEDSWGIFPSSLHASFYRWSYHCARCVQVHRRRSSTTKCQISHRRYSLPIPNLSMTVFSFCELHKRNHWDCLDCMTYWPRALPQLKLSHTRRQPRDFLSQESWKHVTKSTGFNWKKLTRVSTWTYLC